MWLKWTLVCTCCTKKHFVNLYQASLDKKGKHIESNTTAFKEHSIEANNALVVYNATPLIDIKDLNVLEFF